MIRILLADDHHIVRFGLRTILELEHDLKVVAEAATADDTVRKNKEFRPHVVLLDLRMPGDGHNALSQLMALPKPPAVVILTTSELEEDIHRALQQGAAGYLPKTTPPEEIIAALRRVAAGGSAISGAIAVKRRNSTMTPALSPREKEVLALMSKGLTNGDIARILAISLHTAKFHVAAIIRKLDVADRTEACTEALRRGIIPDE